MSDYPQDGSTCCSHEPPGQEVTQRCPVCKHYYTRIDGVLNCTWPDCPTNEGLETDAPGVSG